MQKLEGATIKHYDIQRYLAKGGMSEIYLALDTYTNQEVAIKFVRIDDDEYCERFRREVKVVATLKHDHILPALDYGEYDKWDYLVTPYIKAGTLDETLASGPLSPKKAGHILAQLASALQFAHDHGIVHRDIKPSNVLLHEGNHVYLTDFGLVKRSGAKRSLTQSGFMIGTPEYIAPELVHEPSTSVSDQYALGILLYQMLTGRVPFSGSSPVAIVWNHVQDAPEPPSSINPSLPCALEQVVLRALEKKPENRFASVSEFSAAYQVALADVAQAQSKPLTLSTNEQQTSDASNSSHSLWKNRFSAASTIHVPGSRVHISRPLAVAAAASLLCIILVAASMSLYGMIFDSPKSMLTGSNTSNVPLASPAVEPSATAPSSGISAGVGSGGTTATTPTPVVPLPTATLGVPSPTPTAGIVVSTPTPPDDNGGGTGNGNGNGNANGHHK